ncbi:MAG: winged helix-turn-helix domain-containing protein [Acidobacteria bacterium]|nr:winged helix-turn-helix domain-containing protein [Acidobacteriota bacterium]MCA1627791.1 winged helix-turn-helix domain-containing protein [Acidobacteriota bacterium]
MNQLDNLTYEFGPYRLNLAQRSLTRDGETVALSPKATEILVRLVVNAGHVVEKDDLLRDVWPDTFVEESNLTQNIFVLRRALGDERAGPKYIETVARRGYRFVASVKVYESDGEGPVVEPEVGPSANGDGEAAPERIVVAVMPFINATGDEGLEYLAEGLTDNIINNLSRVSRLRVMSRTAVFRYNADDVDPRAVGKQLNAKAVLVGKIQVRPALVVPATLEKRSSVGTLRSTARTGRAMAKPTRTAAGVARTRAGLTEATADSQLSDGGDRGRSGVVAGSSGAGLGDVARDPDGNASAAGGVGEAEIASRAGAIVITAELVEVATGWQLWGETFDSGRADLLQIQDAITRQLLLNLKLKLSGEEEKHVTARYTENPGAYEAYLEGRYHWSRYTRAGIEKAIGHFREAIEQDPNYALAYAAIVDCYLRLATNYLPPEDDRRESQGETSRNFETGTDHRRDERLKLRFKWDWKGVEREVRRASELKTSYPSIHQWYVAYQTSKRLYKKSLPIQATAISETELRLPSQISFIQLTPEEEVQILCSIVRDQLATGNYDAAHLILQFWSVPGKWPKLNRLNAYTAADLLFTSGTLFGCLAGTKQVLHGHRHAEALLNGSIALFEQLGIKSRSAEARVELTRCYYRQGLLDMAKETVLTAISELPEDEIELKTLALIILGVIERDSGRLGESLRVLREAAHVEIAGCLVTGRCNIDLATTLKELGFLEQNEHFLGEAKLHFLKALHESEALGHHRNVASAENNIGFLLLDLKYYDESESHLLRARKVFEALRDNVRGAQVNDTLARLYSETKRYVAAEEAIDRAVDTLVLTDSEALLAEALTTKATIACKQELYSEAKRCFEAAHRVAERCGDHSGAGRALVGLFEEMRDGLDSHERMKILHELTNLLSVIQQPSLVTRIKEAIARTT